MNTPLRTTLFCSMALALTFGLSSCGCGDQGGYHGSMDGRTGDRSATDAVNGGSDGSGTTPGGMNADGTTSGTSGGNTTGTNGTLGPGAERMNAVTDLGGLRATLMAELEAVRTRLNDGTRPEASAKADQERAAELAQGLERLDRALAAVNASNDTTWAAIRTNTNKEVEDIRAWMATHGMKAQG